MIFRQWEQVLNKLKTQTRRLVKDGDCAYYNDEGRLWRYSLFGHGAIIAVWRNGRRWLEVGRTYSIQPGRGKKAVGRIRLTKIRRGRLQDINILDIYAEGIEPAPLVGAEATIMMERYAFANLWNSIYAREGERFEDNPEVWALTFEMA